MRSTQHVFFIPSLGREISNFLIEVEPLHRRRKAARYLQHFDLWLRHTRYKSLTEDLLPLEAYVYFYLSHVSLYPGPKEPEEPRDYYLRVDIDDLLVNRELKGFGRLTSRQAAFRVAAAMKWQEHHFGRKLDTLRSKMKTLYQQANYYAYATEITGKSQLYSIEYLELISTACRVSEHWVRDLAMVRLLQETQCTIADLAEAVPTDFNRRSNDDWYFTYGADIQACLTEGTAILVQVLLGRHFYFEEFRVSHNKLFTMGDGLVAFEMSARNIELVLERRFRFALMVTSVNCPTDANLYVQEAEPFPKGFVSEKTIIKSPLKKYKTVENLQFSEEFNNTQEHSAAEPRKSHYFYEDWDEAIRNCTLTKPEPEPKILGVPDLGTNSHHSVLRNRRVLIAGESIDESIWAIWGEK